MRSALLGSASELNSASAEGRRGALRDAECTAAGRPRHRRDGPANWPARCPRRRFAIASDAHRQRRVMLQASRQAPRRTDGRHAGDEDRAGKSAGQMRHHLGKACGATGRSSDRDDRQSRLVVGRPRALTARQVRLRRPDGLGLFTGFTSRATCAAPEQRLGSRRVLPARLRVGVFTASMRHIPSPRRRDCGSPPWWP